jgi:glycosyltransferase involved in cell wall biosynthesis
VDLTFQANSSLHVFSETLVLDQVTPLILTFNEAPNIGRTLERVRWAHDVVIVDSFSTDETLVIVSRFSNARLFQRKFDAHSEQWNFGLEQTGIRTEWVLAMDADYIISDKLLREIEALTPEVDVAGYRVPFNYCVQGQPLSATVYPSVIALYRRERAKYVQDGHTQRVQVQGKVADLSGVILHDDRKPLSRWVASQDQYMRLEANKLINAKFSQLNWTGQIRKLRVVAPFAVLFYCLFVKGLALNGRAGVLYSFQRSFAELLLSLHLLSHDVMSHVTSLD